MLAASALADALNCTYILEMALVGNVEEYTFWPITRASIRCF